MQEGCAGKARVSKRKGGADDANSEQSKPAQATHPVASLECPQYALVGLLPDAALVHAQAEARDGRSFGVVLERNALCKAVVLQKKGNQ